MPPHETNLKPRQFRHPGRDFLAVGREFLSQLQNFRRRVAGDERSDGGCGSLRGGRQRERERWCAASRPKAARRRHHRRRRNRRLQAREERLLQSRIPTDCHPRQGEAWERGHKILATRNTQKRCT